jgi:hypothetical protein
VHTHQSTIKERYRISKNDGAEQNPKASFVYVSKMDILRWRTGPVSFSDLLLRQ